MARLQFKRQMGYGMRWPGFGKPIDQRGKLPTGALGALNGPRRQVPALAGVAQWTECEPANQKVAGLIPS